MGNDRALKQGKYGFRDLQAGDRILTDGLMVTADMIDAFAALTGDYFEIHMNDDAAMQHGFSSRVAHGLLILSLIDGLKNRAKASFRAQASLGWDWQFSAPVLVGDELRAEIIIESIKPLSDGLRAVINLNFDVKNQNNETVQKGINKLMIYA